MHFMRKSTFNDEIDSVFFCMCELVDILYADYMLLQNDIYI